MLGDQQSSPMCGRSCRWFSPTPCSHSARSSSPITAPIARQTERLNEEPSAFGLGKEVGQRPSGAQRDCTPWMQLPPQSYSGIPSRLTLPFGELRATRSVGFSSSVSLPMRSSMRVAGGSDASQNG